MTGTTDRRKCFHAFGLAITSNEKEEDFEFVFQAIKDNCKKFHNFEYEPTILIADNATSITNGFMCSANL